MSQAALMELIGKCFSWLAHEPGCELMTDYDHAAFGNAVIVYRLATFAVRIVVDRSQVWVDVGPRDAVEESELWTAMEVAIAFLRQDEVLSGSGSSTPVGINHGASLESQVQEYARVLMAQYPSLVSDFGNEGFSRIKDSLGLFRKRCATQTDLAR